MLCSKHAFRRGEMRGGPKRGAVLVLRRWGNEGRSTPDRGQRTNERDCGRVGHERIGGRERKLQRGDVLAIQDPNRQDMYMG